MMRKRREKFPLELRDGAKVMTMDDLRLYFDLEKILAYLDNGKLEKFLRDRFYSDEADAIKKLRANNPETPKKLCEILNVSYEKFADLAEEIFWRKERLDRLKKFTSDEDILKRVDDVAFNQDDLEDILSQETIPETIYLCEQVFRFPSGILRIKNIRYVGIGKKVTVVIESNGEINFDKLKISFENIKFDRAYGYSVPTVEVAKVEKTVTLKNKLSLLGKNTIAILVENAKKFKAQISVKIGNETYDAKNYPLLKAMHVNKGEKITVSATGVDSQKAVDTLFELIDNKFN